MEQEVEQAGSTFKALLETELFSIGKYSLSVYEIIAAVLVVVLAFAVSRVVKRIVYRSSRFDLGKKFAITQIIHYVVVVISGFLVLKSLGVDISPFLLGSGALLVGVGLGLQNLFLDFVSGIIILIDRSVKVGDVVDIEGTIGSVTEIKMRTTQIHTRDNKSIIFPNSALTKDKLINFSHNDDLVMFTVEVGVHYDTDINIAERLMIESAEEHDCVDVAYRKPFVRLENFGDSSLDLALYFFSSDLIRAPQIRSDLRRKILNKFRENNINIPFPIRTLDFPKEYFAGK